MASEETQARRQAGQEVVGAGQKLVDGLFGENSGIGVRRGTDAERMEAEGVVGKSASVELLRDTAGEVKRYWDRAKREVVLFDGATVETLGHEIAWHAVRQWAETRSPELLAKMNEYAKRCPEELRKLIGEAYRDFSGDAGAGRAEPGDRRLSLVGRRTDGIDGYESDPAVLKMPCRKRKKQFRDVMVRQYAERTARFTRNGQTCYAAFEEGDVRKNIHGDQFVYNVQQNRNRNINPVRHMTPSPQGGRS